MSDIVAFLEARIAEDEAGATPGTVVISGGWPAPEVPNCVGADGRGCERGWEMTVPINAPTGWWKSEDIRQIIKAHEMTHVTEQQRRILAECTAKREIVAKVQGLDFTLLEALAYVYKDHPDYDKNWRR